MKTCAQCGETKPRTQFYAKKNSKDGHHSRCKPCAKAYALMWYHANSDRIIPKRRQHRRDNRDMYRARDRARYESHRAEHAANNRLARFGLTEDEYQRMLIDQAGRCAICEEPMTKPHVDHCHTTRQVRGLLCGGCNTGMGHMKDDPARLRAAAEYLEQPHLQMLMVGSDSIPNPAG